MSIFDGSDEELTYGQALCELAQRVSWPTEKHGIAVLRAIQKEYGLLPPEPDRKTLYNDPRDLTLAQQDDEIASLKKQVERAKLEAELAKAQADTGEAPARPAPAVAPVENPFPHAGTAGEPPTVAPAYPGA